jgi:cytochrome c biogenesis protein CcmG, thiol:disulfide interchange protein DsbE
MRMRLAAIGAGPIRGRWLLALALVAVALVVAIVVVASRETPSPKSQATSGIGFVRVSRAAPAVTMPSLTGSGNVGIAGLTGKPIVINFWATWCDNCVAETKALVQVADSTRGRVNFLGIDTLDEQSLARAFVAKYRIPYQVSFDPREVVGTRYGIPGLPVTVFLSPSGTRILGVNTGGLTVRSLDKILHELYGPTA